MKLFLKKISIFLLVCLLNTICPFPALAADITSMINNLSADQKAKIRNLTPQQKAEIKKALGFEVEEATQSSPSQTAGYQSATFTQATLEALDNETAVSAEAVEKELSALEKLFTTTTKEGTSEGIVLEQFGYEMFNKTVGQRFSSTAGIPLGADYTINTGDQLVVTVWGNINDSYALAVDERGTVTLPKVGTIQLAGYSIAKAKDILAQRLTETYVADFNIDLTLKEIGSIKVYVVGNVKNPGAYTLRSNNTLYDAIFLAGGSSKKGTLRNIRLLRNNRIIQTADLYQFILYGKKSGDVVLKSGDVVHVPPIGSVVAVSGNVRRPAIYELKGKTGLKDFMIGLAGGITPTTYLQRLQIERKKDNRVETAVDVNYADYLKNSARRPVYLQDLDFVKVFTIDSAVKNVVYIKGNVKRPGRYELQLGMRLSDLITKAQGLAPDTYLKRAQLVRGNSLDLQPQIMTINLSKLRAGEIASDPYLKEFDHIRIFSKEEIEGKPSVFISGDVNDNDNVFPLAENMRVSDLIFQAGGLKESADLSRAELIRNIDNKIYSYILDLDKVLNANDQKENMLLQRNDYLFIRKDPNYYIGATVSLRGNVRYPGKYVLYKGERLSSVLKRAGGFTDKAFLEGAIFIRESLKERQLKEVARVRREFNERKRMELDQIPFGLPSGEAAFRASAINRSYEFALKKLELEIPGRVIIDLKNLHAGNSQDIILQNGDTLTIPNKEMGVIVMGEVYTPATILYEKGKTVNDYINACGGETTFADKDAIRVLRSSGKTEKINWVLSISPGDTIYVPTKAIALTRSQKPFDWNQFWDTASGVARTLASVTSSLVSVYLLYKTAQN